jgi:hypothetical protein
MALAEDEVPGVAKRLASQLDVERQNLDALRRYWTARQALPLVIPADAPREVREMARISRVNVLKIVVESYTQSLVVEGIRGGGGEEAQVARLWQIWQRNAMDRRHMGLHRAGGAYGLSYGIALPGDPVPVLRTRSPRRMTTAFDASGDDMWPMFALDRVADGAFALYDDRYRWSVGRDRDEFVVVGSREHGATFGGVPVCPVVRFLDAEDLDADDEPDPGALWDSGYAESTQVTAGVIAPLLPLQDQINMTSFGLKAAEWYSAFRQRWAVGMKASRADRVKAGASQLWAFDVDPESLRLGEFSATDLRGYLDSRDMMMRYAATLSQTPVHEMTGQLVNLSAEALAAAEIGRDRMTDERKISYGESHEQLIRLAGEYAGVRVGDGLQTVWRDTSARAFGAVVDGLGKIAAQLGVPEDELWARIPGVTQADVDRWRARRAETDPEQMLLREVERSAGRDDPQLLLPPGVSR